MAYGFRRDDVLGEDVLGEGYYGGHMVGVEEAAQAAAQMVRAAAAAPAAPARAVRFPHPPEWRERLAPGVAKPGTKLYPVPLTPSAGGGIFLPALTSIVFSARPQKPFRGERLIALVSRSAGAAAVIPVGEIFVGTDLVQGAAGSMPLETFAPNAFGVRMAWPQAEPGIEIRVNASLVGVLAAGESIAVSLMVLGETEA